VALWLYNWTFDAYCLIPEMKNGRIIITPREPKVSCEILLPEKILWDDQRKEYSPNPFTVSSIVRNTGTREARNLRQIETEEKKYRKVLQDES